MLIASADGYDDIVYLKPNFRTSRSFSLAMPSSFPVGFMGDGVRFNSTNTRHHHASMFLAVYRSRPRPRSLVRDSPNRSPLTAHRPSERTCSRPQSANRKPLTVDDGRSGPQLGRIHRPLSANR